jgi:tripartite-type tricarboxylate transporter receptor subunit TctC
MKFTRRRLVAASCASLASVWRIAPRADAQDARRATRMLVGFPPGGSTDVIARLLVPEMKGYAATIVVENRAGAAGRIALEILKAAAADGSVIALTPAPLIVLAPFVYKTLNYRPQQDFVPVSTVCSAPDLLAIGPLVPRDVRTLADFVAWCRANPARATYGSPGAGTQQHLVGAILGRTAGFEFLHVPYQGAAPSMQDLLGGQIASNIHPIVTALAHIASGNLRGLAVTSPERSAELPGVPTMKEAGYPALEMVQWYGIFVPARTPAQIVDRLNGTIRDALKTPEVKSGLARLSLEVAGNSPVEFARQIKLETERWGPIVKASGFTPEG